MVSSGVGRNSAQLAISGSSADLIDEVIKQVLPVFREVTRLLTAPLESGNVSLSHSSYCWAALLLKSIPGDFVGGLSPGGLSTRDWEVGL